MTKPAKAKARPVRTPRHITVRDNVPPGGQVVLSPEARGWLLRFFGDAVRRRLNIHGREDS